MTDLNDIIDRILVEERLKTETVISEVPILKYRCDEHRYNIRYNEATEMALYDFDGQVGSIETAIPLKQRNYYVDSGYWTHENQTKA